MTDSILNYLIDRLHNCHQSSTVDAFYARFEFLHDMVLASFPELSEGYLISGFICGRKHDIQVYVLQCHANSLVEVVALALSQENYLLSMDRVSNDSYGDKFSAPNHIEDGQGLATGVVQGPIDAVTDNSSITQKQTGLVSIAGDSTIIVLQNALVPSSVADDMQQLENIMEYIAPPIGLPHIRTSIVTGQDIAPLITLASSDTTEVHETTDGVLWNLAEAGTCKCILATNFAETSLTIDGMLLSSNGHMQWLIAWCDKTAPLILKKTALLSIRNPSVHCSIYSAADSTLVIVPYDLLSGEHFTPSPTSFTSSHRQLYHSVYTVPQTCTHHGSLKYEPKLYSYIQIFTLPSNSVWTCKLYSHILLYSLYLPEHQSVTDTPAEY